MYAMWTLFTLGPGMRGMADQMGDVWIPILRAMPGFAGGTFIRNNDAGEYGALTVWDTRDAAEAAFAQSEPQFQEQVVRIAQGPVTRTIFEVWRQVEPG